MHPRASLGPLPKNVSKYVAFWTFQNLENQAPAWAGAQFSLCVPTPKKSSKMPSKTFLLGSSWLLKRSKCGKKGHLKMHSKIQSEKYPKNITNDSKMGLTLLAVFHVSGFLFGYWLPRWLLEAPKAPTSRKITQNKQKMRRFFQACGLQLWPGRPNSRPESLQ